MLIPLGLVLLGVAVWAFMWAVRSGQFEDLEGPAHRILMDDDEVTQRQRPVDDTAGPKPAGDEQNEAHTPLQDKGK